MSRDLAPATPESVGLKPEGLENIDAYLRDFVDLGTLAGAVTLVARHGKTVHTSVMGKKDLESGEPLAMDTIFRVFSMTKPVTGVAMMILLDELLWSPDDPISKHLPEFEGVRVFDGLDADGQPKTVAPDSPPTMRELMTHTAGFSYGFNPEDPLDKLYIDAKVWQSASLADFIRKLAGIPLAYQPGTKWVYSLSMDVQAAIIERLSGQSAPDFYRTRIFEPLGMTDTSFGTPTEKLDRLAALYAYDAATGRAVRDDERAKTARSRPRFLSGGGGLVSSAADYNRFSQMLLREGELEGVRLLGPRTVRYMTENHLPGGVDLEEIGQKSFSETRYNGVGFGLGFSVVVNPAKHKVLSSLGEFAWGGAASTAFWVDPKEELTVLFFTQLMPSSSNHIRPELKQLVYQSIVD